jgi:MarR family transcriptional regulator, organic hydroperoxide resistance regulator
MVVNRGATSAYCRARNATNRDATRDEAGFAAAVVIEARPIRDAAWDPLPTDQHKKSKPNAMGHPHLQLQSSQSSAYLVRQANRSLQRVLEMRIASSGIRRGQWYFLRVLWEEDGLSQRNLSARVGTKEPTAAMALQSMEKSGFIRRVRSKEDSRRTHVWLTPKAKRMRDGMLAVVQSITRDAEKGIPKDDLRIFRRAAEQMIANLGQLKK